MIKRIISIGSIALMLLSVLVVMDIVPVPIVKAATNPPYDLWDGILGNGIYGTDGDWTLAMGDSFTYTNPDPHTIIVNGNLTIEAGASLTLQGVTLKMATPDNGTFGIRILPASSIIFQAELIIENDGATPSIITSNITDGDHRFGFVVEGPDTAGGNPTGPSFTMVNSELHECGWNFSETDNSDGGLWIGTSDVIIDNNVISDNYAGIILYGIDATNPTITNNDIHDNTMAPGIYLFNVLGTILTPITIGPGNTATNNFWGVFIRSSRYVNVTTNTLNNNGEYGFSGGLAIDNGGTALSSNIYIYNNVINGNAEYSLDVVGSILGLVNDVYVYNNDLYGPTNLTYFEYVSGLEIKNNNICQGGALPNVTYFLASLSSGIIFDNNVVNDNIGIGALFNVCQATVTNNHFERNPAGGFGLQYGSFDSEIHNNIVKDNGDMGLHLVASNLNISNNVFEGNGDGDPYQDDPRFQDCGMDIMNSYGITIYDNEFNQNVMTTGSEPVNGIYLLQSENIQMESNIMDRNDNNLYCRGDTTDIRDNNSTYTCKGGMNDYDVYLEDAWLEDQFYHDPPLTGPYGPNHVTFLNVSFTKSEVRIEDAISGDLTVKWYKHIIVEDNSHNPVSGASVYINDSNGDPEPSSGQPFTTNARGMVTFVPLTEYFEDKSGRTYYTPHDIEAIDGDRKASDTANMANSHYNTLLLNERPQVIDIWPHGGAIPTDLYRTNIIQIHANGSDAEDTEDALTPYFEYRVNDTSPWVSDTDPGNYFVGSAQWDAVNEFFWIEFQPPAGANLGLYDFRVRFEDTYPSSSDWLNSTNCVNVLNNVPNAEDILVLTVPPEVYRGQSIDIYADASDIEDIDEDTTWNAELQYLLNGSATWSDVYITLNAYDSISGNWKFVFSPPASSPDPRHGPVDFQVRFQDSDGDWSGWYQEPDLVDILNNPPSFVDFGKDANSVYRGDTIRLYTNVSDPEESEANLYVHFYYSKDGSTWVDNWLSTPNIGSGGRGEWDGVHQRFFVEFTPPDTADTGNYQFRLYISDSDGAYLTHVPGDNVVEVMNNPPIALYPVSASGPEVRAGGGFVYIYVNADDAENLEDQLDLRVQQRYNESGNPPDVWYDTYISTETYEGTPPTGRLRAIFAPLSGAQLGWYDFRAWVWDEDVPPGTSNFVYLFHAVEVLNPEPTLEDIALGMTEVYRGDILYIFLNASDLSDDESELTPEIQYLPEGGSWTDIPSSRMTYNAAAGCWVIEFIPADDAKIGTYYFKARVKNTAQGYSDQGAWEEGSKWTTGNIAQVKNSKPIASNLRVEGGNTVERGDTIYIFADVTDAEFDPDEMTAHFEYREEGGSWEDEYLGNLKAPTGGSNSWRITFSPPEDDTFTLGLYDFRVWFEDDEDTSNFVQEDDLVDVLNVKPTVEVINVDEREGYRSEPILITADASDPETAEHQLTPTFEYSIDGVNWVGVEDSGSYFQDTPQYVNSQWQIYFEPPSDADLGKYSFRVKFSDGVDESDWMTKDNYYDLKNNEPEVEITSPSPGVQSSAEVSFFATATDDEDTTLTWEWDFGDGSEFSDEESPTHTYDKAGDYRVTVKVTDSDGGDSTHYIDITIEAGAAEEEFPMVLLLLLLIIIIVVVLLLVLLLTKKKKKPEEIPPAVPGMAPGIGPPVAPPAVPGMAPAAPPGAPPAAIPAAIPAAVPAGPPKEAAKAGQHIKCPKCGTAFTVESAERPITIECPNCHAKGKLT